VRELEKALTEQRRKTAALEQKIEQLQSVRAFF